MRWYRQRYLQSCCLLFRQNGGRSAVYPARFAISIAAKVSVKVPIWLILIKIEFAMFLDTFFEDLGVRHEQIVTNDLNFLAQTLSPRLPSLPNRLQPCRLRSR